MLLYSDLSYKNFKNLTVPPRIPLCINLNTLFSYRAELNKRIPNDINRCSQIHLWENTSIAIAVLGQLQVTFMYEQWLKAYLEP